MNRRTCTQVFILLAAILKFNDSWQKKYRYLISGTTKSMLLCGSKISIILLKFGNLVKSYFRKNSSLSKNNDINNFPNQICRFITILPKKKFINLF